MTRPGFEPGPPRWETGVSKTGVGSAIAQAVSRRLPTAAKRINASLFNFFNYLVCEAVGTAASPGLLCQPRVIVNTQ
jgi:hypothetical protein